MMSKSNLRLGTALLLLSTLAAAAGSAHHRPNHGVSTEPTEPTEPVAADVHWMHIDVGDAHTSSGDTDPAFTGVGSRITVIDDFTSGDVFEGRLDGRTIELQQHGDWTFRQTRMLAFGSDPYTIDFNSDEAFVPDRTGLNVFDVVNLSYSVNARAAFASAFNTWDNFGNPHSSVLRAVNGNLAFAAKAAGNDNGAAVGAAVSGKVDVLAQQFIRIIDDYEVNGRGTAPVIFVGALEWNPDHDGGRDVEQIASYSSVAGTNLDVQRNFLVVGVEGGRTATDSLANYGSNCGSVDGTCLYGTSFAAPIVAGYAAIVADKYDATANPSLVARTLLESAQSQNLPGGETYNRAIYGAGEACLSCALGAVSIQ